MPRSLSALVMLMTRESAELGLCQPSSHPVSAIDWAHGMRVGRAIEELGSRLKKKFAELNEEEQQRFIVSTRERYPDWVYPEPAPPGELDPGEQISRRVKSLCEAVRRDARRIWQVIYGSELVALGQACSEDEPDALRTASSKEILDRLLERYARHLDEPGSESLSLRHARIFARLNRYGMIERHGEHSYRYSMAVAELHGLTRESALLDLKRRLRQLFNCSTRVGAAVGYSRPDWEAAGSDLIRIQVDTSEAGFSGTPIYLTSWTGGHWCWGVSCVHEATARSFQIYAQPHTTDRPTDAGGVLWIGIDPEVVSHAGQRAVSGSWSQTRPEIWGCQEPLGSQVILSSLGVVPGKLLYHVEGASLLVNLTDQGFWTYLFNGPNGGTADSAEICRTGAVLQWVTFHHEPDMGHRGLLAEQSVGGACQPGCGGSGEPIHREPNRDLCRLVFHVRHDNKGYKTAPWYFTALQSNGMLYRGFQAIYSNQIGTERFMLFITQVDRNKSYEVYTDGGQVLHWMGIEPMDISSPESEFPLLLV